MMYLQSLNTGAQATIKLLTYEFGAAATNDLLIEGAAAFQAGASSGAILDFLFKNTNVQSAHPLLGPVALDKDFVTELINNIAGPVTSATMATTKAGWVTAAVAALPNFASRGAFAAAVNTWFDAQTNVAGTDLGLVKEGLANRMEAAAWYAQQPAGATFSSMDQITTAVASVTDDPATVTAVQTGSTAVAPMTISPAIVAPVTTNPATVTVPQAGSPAGLSFALTSAVDHVTGGSGNDTFTGTYDAAVTDTFNATDILAGNGGSDTLNIAHLFDVAITPPDVLWTGISGIEKIVINTTGNGAQTITTGANFEAAFAAAGIDLTMATSGTGAITINMNSAPPFTGAATITTTSTAGAQTITTGSGHATVHATSGAGGLTISGANLDTVTATTTGSGAQTITSTGAGAVSVTANSFSGTQTIFVGNGNDTVNVSGSNAAALAHITVGSGNDTITLTALHTGVNTLTFSAANAGSQTVLTSLTGLVANDTITFVASGVSSTVTNEGAVGNIAAGVSGATLTSGITEFNTGGNTYFYEYTGATATSELVCIVGSAAATATLNGSVATVIHA